MNREELEKKLKMTGVPEYIYNLTDHGKKDERLCLERDQDKFIIRREELRQQINILIRKMRHVSFYMSNYMELAELYE